MKINRTKRKQLCITITLIVENTNRKINNLLTSVSEEKLQTNTFMKVTTLEEVQAFVGLLLYWGLDSAKKFDLTKAFFRHTRASNIYYNHTTRQMVVSSPVFNFQWWNNTCLVLETRLHCYCKITFWVAQWTVYDFYEGDRFPFLGRNTISYA